ncbi:MAG: hypothetical protein HQK89_11740 [Nitrospirae bacterium]|nr:hypothetical protein [Nitrospirota bacterium]
MISVAVIVVKKLIKSPVCFSFTALLALFLFVQPAHCAEKYDVIVIESSGFRTFEDVVAGFKSTCNCNIKKIIPIDVYSDITLDEVYRLKPRVIFAIGAKALRYLSVINDLPIVYTMVSRPRTIVEEKKNIIGVSTEVPFEKQLNAISRIFPSVKRLGIMYNPADSINTTTFNNISSKAALLKITLTEGKFHNSKGLISAVDLMDGNIDSLWLTPDPLMTSPELIEYIMLHSIKYGIPVFSFMDRHLELGASLVITTDPGDVGTQAGEIANIMSRSLQPENYINESKFATVMINKLVASKMGCPIAESYKNKNIFKIDLMKKN